MSVVVSSFSTVQKPLRIPWRVNSCRSYRVVDLPVVFRRQVPMVLTVQRPVVIPQVRFLGKVVGLPVVVQREVPMVQTVRRPVEIPQVPRSPSRLHSCCSWIGLWTCLFVVRR